jgi:hypothetical protein
MHTAEISLRTNILGEPARQHIRPLSETKCVLFHFVISFGYFPRPPPPYTHTRAPHRAIENGANALAESFLFGVAALLILSESYRASSKQSKRRDDVDEKLEGLLSAVERLQEGKKEVEGALERSREEVEGERKRREALERVVERLVGVGVRAGWGDASVWEGTPLKMVRGSDAASADPTSSTS